jgi:DNA ligase-1
MASTTKNNNHNSKQSSLDSFLGIASNNNAKKEASSSTSAASRQSKMESFFHSKTTTTTTTTTNIQSAAVSPLSNSEEVSSSMVETNDDDSSNNPKKRSSGNDKIEESIPKSIKRSNKRRVIDDDEDDVKHHPSNDTQTATIKTNVTRIHLPNVKTDQEILQKEIPPSWQPGTSVPYGILCEAFAQMEAVTSRLAIQEILTTLIRQVLLISPQHLITILYLASNSVAPAYDCIELGIGDALLIKSIAEATGSSHVKAKYEKVGDLGTIAETCKQSQKTVAGFFGVTKKGPVTCTQVLDTFRNIANTKGSASQKIKIALIHKLIVQATPAETKYIIRGLQGKLRIGVSQSTVLIALAHALAISPPKTITANQMPEGSHWKDDESVTKTTKTIPSEVQQYMDKSLTSEKRLEAAVAIVKKAYSEVPSYETILQAALRVPLPHLHTLCTLTPGIPVAPMLAKPTKSIHEVLKRLSGLRFTCEYKYDGERAQIHMLPDGTTKVFSRNLLDTTSKYPEVPEYVKEAAQQACNDNDNHPNNALSSFVMDAEVVAYNRITGQLVPFQILSTRKKTEESAESAKVQVIVQAFDLMYLNGTSLLSKPFRERRDLLKRWFQPVVGKFDFAKSIDIVENGDTTVLEEFLDAAVKGQCEGLMVKTLDDDAAIYEPSRRSLNWLKLKKDYLQGLGDSFDLVPLGGYFGRGKRTGVYGAYLLACYDPETEEFQSVCKIGTGFSDQDLQELSASLNEHKIPQKSRQYNVKSDGPLECDVWFDAVQVWEVKAADLSKSSAHRGAVDESGRGIGLRFPRFERVRTDKTPEQATTSAQILEMYYQQESVQVNNTNDDFGDDDDEDGI